MYLRICKKKYFLFKKLNKKKSKLLNKFKKNKLNSNLMK